MSPQRFTVLDTTIVLHLIRGNEVAERIEEKWELSKRADKPLISVVTVGECHGFARYRRWGIKKTDILDRLLRQLVIVDINKDSIIRHYAEIHAHATRSGYTLSNNDVWIAATTVAVDGILLTADKDFDPLHPDTVQREYVDPTAR